MSMEKILTVIKENLSESPDVNEKTSLRNDLNIDSLDVIMIFNAIEDEFSISLEEEDFDKVDTPEEIMSLLKSKYNLEDA